MLRVRFIDRPGTPGRVAFMRPEEVENELQGIDAKVYVDFGEVETDPLIIPDGASEVVVILVPEPPVAIAIGVGMIAAIATVAVVDTTIKQMRHQMQQAARMAEKFSQIDFPSPAASIRGSKNTFRANGRVPLVFGEHRLTPDLAGRPYTSYHKNAQRFHQIFCLGYSDVHYSDPKLGDNPLSNYTDAVLSPRATQYYDVLMSEMLVGIRLKHNHPITRTTPDNTTRLKVGITFPSGLLSYDSNANRQTATVSIGIRYRPVGGQWSSLSLSITAGSDSYRTMYTKHVSPGSYEVEVKRHTEDSKSGKTMDSAYWDVLQSELTIDGSTLPIGTTKCSLASMRIKASDQINGIVEDFNVLAKLHCRDYLGTGTGPSQWVKRATRNPASALLYLLTHFYVNKKPVFSSKIQWGEFEEFHRWCSQKGFYFDAVISGDYTIGDIAAMICTAGRAKLTRFNGMYGVQIERPSTALDFALTPLNTKGGMTMAKIFNEQTQNLAVKFIDRTNGYVEVTRVCSIDDKGAIHYDRPESQRKGETTEISLVGVTDPGHAMKLAAFELARLNRRTIQYTVPQDWEQMTAFPGAVGYLANDMFLYGLGSGKVRARYGSAGAWTGVDLDTEVTMETGKSYSLMIRMNDPAHGIKIHPLTANAGTSNTLRFATPVTQEIEAGNLCIFGEAGKEGIRVLCEAISQGGNDDGTLSLVEYAEEIYQADSGQIPAWEPKITIPKSSSHEPTYPLIEMVSDLGRKEGRTAASTPTYQELADGYNFQGGDAATTPKGTTTPSDVTLEAEGVFRGIVLRWDRQVNLTNLARYEVQVSDDSGSSWYSLKFDGSGYKDTLNAWTAWPSETLVHAGIPPAGTDTAPAGRKLKYRVRRVTRASVGSNAAAASAQAEGTTSLVETGDVAANAITANNIDTGALNAMIARIRDTLSIGERGFTAVNNRRAIVHPLEGDRRMYLDRDEVHLERYVGQPEFWAVGQYVGLYSRDGAKWTVENYAGMRDATNAAIYANGKFVVVGRIGASSTTPIKTSVDGKVWHPSYPPSGKTLLGIAYGGGQFVAVGREGTTLTSLDGVTWTLRPLNLSLRVTLRSVTYGAGQFVAVGGFGTILTSPDGVTWTKRTSPAMNDLYAITYGAGKFVVTGSGGTILTSPDGATWTKSTSGTMNVLTGVTYGDTRFVAIGGRDTVLASSDGVTWSPQRLSIRDVILDVAHAPRQFVIVGSKGLIYTSPDGVTWTKRTSGTRESLTNIISHSLYEYWESVLLLGGARDELALYKNKERTFSLRANPAAEGAVIEGRVDFKDPIHAKNMFTASNGEWEFNLRPITAGLELAIMKGGGLQMKTEIKNGVMNLVLAGALIAHGGCKVPAGVDWDSQTSGASGLGVLSSVAYGAGKFVAVGTDAVEYRYRIQLFTSADGVTWTRRTVPNPGTVPWLRAITYAAGQFVAVGDYGTIYTSPDGITWTKRTSGAAVFLYSVTYGAGKFVAVGYRGMILTSSDGGTWTKRTSGVRNTLRGITYAAGQFVAVGDYGEVHTSPDGITWTERASAARETLYGITRGADQFVAVGKYGLNTHNSGLAYTSPDGITWTKRASGVRNEIFGVTYASRKFVAVAGNGSIFTSADGATWTERTSESGTSVLYGVAHGAGKFVAVGNVIFTSTDTDIWEQRNKP